MRLRILVGAACVAAALGAPAMAETLRTTTLFEKAGAKTVVALVEGHQTGPQCVLGIASPETKTAFIVGMNGGDIVSVSLSDARPASPLTKSKQGASLPLSVVVDGVKQTYFLKKTHADTAEANVTRAAQNHLRAGLRSRSGLHVALGDAPAADYVADAEAVRPFNDCVMGILRQRMEDASKRLERLAR